MIFQSCHLYFLSNQTQLKFNQDFKACWCFCSCCWAEATQVNEETEFPTCVFGLDTVSCASIHKVVFFGKVVFKDKDKTEVWTKVESIDLKTQRMWTLCAWGGGSKLKKCKSRTVWVQISTFTGGNDEAQGRNLIESWVWHWPTFIENYQRKFTESLQKYFWCTFFFVEF